MKILHVAAFYGDAPGYGGMPGVIGELAKTQAALGHDVHVAATDAYDKHRRKDEHEYREGPSGPVIHLFRNASNRLAYRYQVYLPFGMKQYLKSHIGQFDVVHVHGHRHFPELLAVNAAISHDRPIVFSAHGSIGRLEGKRIFKTAFDLFYGSKILKHTHRVIALSDVENKALVDFGIDEKCIRQVPNGYAPTRPAEVNPLSFRKLLGLGPVERLLLFVGRISQVKGLDTVISAMPFLKTRNVHLAIVGYDSGSQKSLEALARKSDVQDIVHFPGPLYGLQKAEAFAASNLFVLPSLHDAFPTAPLEAVCAGLPVLLSNEVGVGSHFRNVDGAHFPTDASTESFAQAIDHALENNNEMMDRTKRAKRLIESELTWEISTSRVLSVYEEALGSDQQ